VTIVIDASIALKWYWSEPDSEAALALLNAGHRMIAPDLIVAELCNAALRLIRRRQMRVGQMQILTNGAPRAFARLHDLRSLAPRAGGIALAINHPAYDCFYLALSEVQDVSLVTADRKLITKLAGTPFAARTLHLSEAAARG
jgi:predicted nucleic acid-binding protein